MNKTKSIHPGRGCRTLAVLVLAFVLAAVLYQSVSAAVDVERTCTLTVQPGTEGYAEDLASAGIVFDLYRVADAVPHDGSDGYTYGLAEAYAELELPPTGTDAEGWRTTAQRAARIALDPAGAQEPYLSGAALGTPSDVRAGLYLMIVRGSEAEYQTELPDGEGGAELATFAHSREYTYTFSPSLVALPTKEADESGYIGTDNPGDWIYDLSVQLKATQSDRYGSLAIVKSLDAYETQDPATFVFQIDAYTDDARAQRIYSDVAALTFTEPGVQTLLVEDVLPVGSYVVVTEVYTGASYELTVPGERTAVIEANAVVQVAFDNTYTGRRTGGHGILNTFTYGEGGWAWEQSPGAE